MQLNRVLEKVDLDRPDILKEKANLVLHATLYPPCESIISLDDPKVVSQSHSHTIDELKKLSMLRKASKRRVEVQRLCYM